MRVRVQCPSCSERFEVNDSLVGKKVKCRACQKPFLAEAATEAEERGTAIQEPGRRVAAVRSPRDEDDGRARPRAGQKGPGAEESVSDSSDARSDQEGSSRGCAVGVRGRSGTGNEGAGEGGQLSDVYRQSAHRFSEDAKSVRGRAPWAVPQRRV